MQREMCTHYSLWCKRALLFEITRVTCTLSSYLHESTRE